MRAPSRNFSFFRVNPGSARNGRAGIVKVIFDEFIFFLKVGSIFSFSGLYGKSSSIKENNLTIPLASWSAVAETCDLSNRLESDSSGLRMGQAL
jgi:hypothetical protein